MVIDRKIHEVHEFLSGRDIRWHNFDEVGRDEPYYDYYYAEDRLYLIRDVISQQIYFVEASSPGAAMDSLKELFKIGLPVDEEEEW